MARHPGAAGAIDCRTERFEKRLEGYGVVLSTLDKKTLGKPVSVLKQGGLLLSISGSPDPKFAAQQGLNSFLVWMVRLLSLGIRRRARRQDVLGAFHFMHACDEQRDRLTPLIEAGTIRPVPCSREVSSYSVYRQRPGGCGCVQPKEFIHTSSGG